MRAGDEKLFVAGAGRPDAERAGGGEGPSEDAARAVVRPPTTGFFPAASEDFLAAYGDETTDVVETTDQHIGPNSQRPFILTVVAGPQTGFAKVVDSDEMTLGRGYGADLLLSDNGLSRRHCRVFKEGDQIFIEDLGSSNGTMVDGEALRGRRPLEEGARIQVGRHTLLTLSRQDPLEHEAARQLFENSMRDALTDLYNRRFFDQRLREEFAFASRHTTNLSVILLDIDHFKVINDTYGHPAGDEVLREVGTLVKGCFRREDVAFRIGGEEFAIVVRSETHEGARRAAERIRRMLEEARVTSEGEEIRFTASAGVATLSTQSDYDSAGALLAAADRALYRAKTGGRNRCEG